MHLFVSFDFLREVEQGKCKWAEVYRRVGILTP